MEILSVHDHEFRAYGRVIDNVELAPLLVELKKTPITEEVVYVPSVPELENTDTFLQLGAITFGEMPIQLGFCNGHNSMLNALEYHKNSEVNIMATDAILLLGLRSELEDGFVYDTAKVKAFLVPAGTAIEIYATTLHYAPCGVGGEAFQVAVVLPKGTNYPFIQKRDRDNGENCLMTAVNKWLIGHPEGGLDEGTHLGLKGENITVLSAK